MPAIKLLPILEHWECHSCGRCCRGSVIHLDGADLKKLQAQRWEEHPDFRNVQTIVRESWFTHRYRLAQRTDGSCVFLTAEGRCRIHEEFGANAKPLTCRMFPLQLVPREKEMVLTSRRACPTAASDQGPKLESYLNTCREMAVEGELLATRSVPPPIMGNYQADWDGFLLVAKRLEELMTDSRFPLVRRIVHGIRFCSLVEECRLSRLDREQLFELFELLSEKAHDVGDVFADRQPPSAAAAILFRQSASAYLRLHPSFSPPQSWGARWHMFRAAIRFARGKGNVPHFHPELPEVSFEVLEEPLGHLEEAVQRPMVRFFETHATSLQYSLVNRPRWSLVDSFRALALAFPVGLWLLRLCSVGRKPTVNDAVDVVTMLDRGQGYAPLAANQHRSRLRTLNKLSALEGLAAWYAR